MQYRSVKAMLRFKAVGLNCCIVYKGRIPFWNTQVNLDFPVLQQLFKNLMPAACNDSYTLGQGCTILGLELGKLDVAVFESDTVGSGFKGPGAAFKAHLSIRVQI
jgi:hypothetical protein